MDSKIQISGSSVCGGLFFFFFWKTFLTVHAKKFPLCISFLEMMLSMLVQLTATFSNKCYGNYRSHEYHLSRIKVEDQTLKSLIFVYSSILFHAD